ncbi:carbohydrate-binding domain-containing protein [Flexithrix dorotheae]|uniref:carbohydrate-binding domain-containing protein n=1 Tax=Flexithrix dorotheae TaxID=70993 RepID=UPI000375291E|nr:carbohydrate-binding domain-containing protein [Flexithrix dorotheae]
MKFFFKLCGFFILITLSSAIQNTEQNLNVVELKVGDDFQSFVDNQPTNTTFLIKAGVHRMQSVVPKEGQKFIGEVGAIMRGAMYLESGNWEDTSYMGRTLWKYENVPLSPNPEPFKGEDGCENGIPCNRPEDLFLNNNFLKQTNTLDALDESGEWYLDYGIPYGSSEAKNGTTGTVYMFDDPTNTADSVEISLTRFAFGVHSQTPGSFGFSNEKAASHVTVENLVIEKYASLIAYGAIGNRIPGDHWTIKNNEVRYNHGAGIHFASHNLVEGNNVHHNGQIGIKASDRYPIGEANEGEPKIVVDSEVIENDIWANRSPNVGYDWGFEGGGTKFVRTQNLLVKGNHVYGNNGPGLWTDIDNYGTVYELNVVEDNFASGIFHEISGEATIRNNIVSNNAFSHGAQIYVVGSEDVKVYYNEVNIDSTFSPYENPGGILIRRECRFPEKGINNYVHHNIIKIKSGLGQGKNGVEVGSCCERDSITQACISALDTVGLSSNKFDFNTYKISCEPPQNFWLWYEKVSDTCIYPQIIDFESFQNKSQELNGKLNTTQITVVAKGSAVNGVFARFRLYVDGVEVGSDTTTSEYEEYKFCIDIPENEINEVWVEFFNDAYSPPEDRNLFVTSIKVGRKVYLTTEKTMLDKGAKDGVGIIPGQVVLPWNAFLIFNTFPQQYLTVRAKGTAIENVYAHFQVLVNGEYMGEASTMSEFFDYQFPIDLGCTEIENVEIIFDNDAYSNPEDRNLFIEHLGICGNEVHFSADNVNYIRSDGQNIAYKGAMYWGGKMVFDFQGQPVVKAEFRSIDRVVYTGVPVTFTDYSTGNVNTWEWTFGDGQSATAQHPVVSYSQPGIYSVSLSVNNGADVACKSAYIQVLPNKPAPYGLADGGDFEVNPYDFGPLPYDAFDDSLVLDYLGLFERGNSGILGKNGTSSGNHAWVTGLNLHSIELAKTVLYTPNFDLSAGNSYVLEFKAKYSTFADVVGFVVEYSIDKGNSWNLLGNFLGDGWYNSYADLSTTLPEAVYTQFPNMPFFSGSTEGEFKTYFVNISELQGQPNAAFRFRFEANDASSVSGSIGLALDDFQLITNEPTASDYAFAYIRGSKANDVYAHFKTYVNGVLGDSFFAHEPYLYYRIPYVGFPSTIDSIWIQFDNDLLANGQDRNLYVDHLNFKGDTYYYNAGNVKIDPGVHDGIGIIPGQSVIPWNAAMIFDFNVSPSNARHPASLLGILREAEPFMIYPNPGNGKVNLSIGEIKEKGQIIVRDLSGRTIYQENLLPVQSFSKKSIDLLSNKPGLYTMEISRDGISEIQKYIKL